MTTCTWQLRLHGWGPCTQWCRKNCLCTHASGCITGRLRCGTRPECVPLLATHWSALPGPTIPKLWCGRGPPSTAQQGIKVLGTPIGHQDFVAAQLELVRREHDVLLSRIPSINDVQSAWLLLVHCASARACYYLRALRPSVVEEFARAHDLGLWRCLQNILQLDLHQCSVEVQDTATLPLCLGGLGLRSAWRSRVAAHWASWADCLPMIHARHPHVAAELLEQLEGHPQFALPSGSSHHSAITCWHHGVRTPIMESSDGWRTSSTSPA